MSLEQRIKSLNAVRNILDQFVNKNEVNTHNYSKFKKTISLAETKNSWFTEDSIFSVLKYWNNVLS